MTYLFTPILGLLLGLISFVVAPIGMLFAVWLVKWDTEPSAGSYAEDVTLTKIIRGDLPGWLSWFGTPDERCPGNSWEPAIADMLSKRGRTVTTYINLGWRNQMMGMAAYFGKPTTDYIPEGNGFWQRGDIWRLSIPIGFGRIVMGWQVSRKLDLTFLAVPVFTLKRKL